MTEYINLVIKGNETDAMSAANQHDVTTLEVGHNIHKDMMVKVDIAYLSKVFDWFLEPVEHPYPAGTLLHYSVHKDGEAGFHNTVKRGSED